MWADVAYVLGCYLLGSVPFMVYMAGWYGLKIEPGEDLHIKIWGKLGARVGLYGVLFDIIVKGAVPVIFGYFMGFRLATIVSAGVLSVTGQMWPVFRRFEGEKGNTVSLGFFSLVTGLHQFFIMWLIFVPAAIGAGMKVLPRLFASDQTRRERLDLTNRPSRSLPLGIILGFLMMPLVSGVARLPLELTIGLGVLVFLIIVRRLTDKGLIDDLKTGGRLRSVLWNRLLYDRSFV